jgi:hypothetical protein
MTDAPNFLDVETAIHRTMSVVMAMSELIDATFDKPDKRVGHIQHYSLSDGQVDARLEVMSHAVETSCALRELFQAYVAGLREKKAVSA